MYKEGSIITSRGTNPQQKTWVVLKHTPEGYDVSDEAGNRSTFSQTYAEHALCQLMDKREHQEIPKE